MTTASIVVVTKDDPRVLDCLASGLAQDPPFAFELHLVGDWTNDELPDRIEERFGEDPRLTVSRSQAPFMEAWNKAAQATKGEIVVRMDSDTQAEPGWLAALVEPLIEDEGLGWTAGKVLGPKRPRSLTQRYYHERSVGFFERQLEKGPEVTSAPGWNVAYRREGLEAVDWYDESLVASEDWDLHERLTQAGYPGRLVAEAILRHDHPDTVRELFAKEAWYKAGQVQMAQKHGLSSTWHPFQVPLAYAGLATIAIAALAWPPLILAALVLWGLLVVRHWASAIQEGDAVWWSRPFFRLVEAAAGIVGTARGLAGEGWPPWRAP